MSKSQASRWNIGFLSRKPQTDSKTSSSVDHVNGIAIPSTLRVRCPSIQHQAQRSIRIDQRIRGIAASRMTKFYGMNSLFFMLSSTSPVPRLSLTLPPPSSLVRCLYSRLTPSGRWFTKSALRLGRPLLGSFFGGWAGMKNEQGHVLLKYLASSQLCDLLDSILLLRR